MWNNEKELKVNVWDNVVYFIVSNHSWNIAVNNNVLTPVAFFKSVFVCIIRQI